MHQNKQHNSITFPKFAIIEIKEYAFMAAYVVIFYVLLIVQYTDTQRYIDKFSKSSQLLQDFYNAQIYAPSLCMYREFLYSYFINVKWLSKVYHRE